MQKKKECVDKQEKKDDAELHQVGDKNFKTIMKVKHTA